MNTGLERRLAKLERVVPQDDDLQPLGEFIKYLEQEELSKNLKRIFVRFAHNLTVEGDDPKDFYRKIAELKQCGKIDDNSLVAMSIFWVIVEPRYRADGSIDPLPSGNVDGRAMRRSRPARSSPTS
jgi:hypothetical protein